MQHCMIASLNACITRHFKNKLQGDDYNIKISKEPLLECGEHSRVASDRRNTAIKKIIQMYCHLL